MKKCWAIETFELLQNNIFKKFDNKADFKENYEILSDNFKLRKKRLIC